jgi:FixJ family two-component response regulator
LLPATAPTYDFGTAFGFRHRLGDLFVAWAGLGLDSMTKSASTIYVVDDDPSFRAAIGNLLSACGYDVQLYESAAHFLPKLPIRAAACILLDVEMPDYDGPQLQARLAEVGSLTPIIFISGRADISIAVRAMKAGADDFLTKPVLKAPLLAAVERALVRSEALIEQHEWISRRRALYATLTPREQEVFALLVQGKPHKQVAFEIGASERTVKLHRHNLMLKCQARSIAELALIAERLGMLATGERPEAARVKVTA